MCILILGLLTSTSFGFGPCSFFRSWCWGGFLIPSCSWSLRVWSLAFSFSPKSLSASSFSIWSLRLSSLPSFSYSFELPPSCQHLRMDLGLECCCSSPTFPSRMVVTASLWLSLSISSEELWSFPFQSEILLTSEHVQTEDYKDPSEPWLNQLHIFFLIFSTAN